MYTKITKQEDENDILLYRAKEKKKQFKIMIEQKKYHKN